MHYGTCGKVQKETTKVSVMTRKEIRKQKVQELTRYYLGKLQREANRYGLGDWLKAIRKANERGECESTEYTLNQLAKLCDDERMYQKDVTRLFGLSYAKAFDCGLFEKIRKIKCNGTFSKVDAVLRKAVLDEETKQKKGLLGWLT